jgi:hypothetical protein
LRRRLQQQGGLADAGLTAEKISDPGTMPPPRHAIELADARRDAIGLRRFDSEYFFAPGARQSRRPRNDASSVP